MQKRKMALWEGIVVFASNHLHKNCFLFIQMDSRMLYWCAIWYASSGWNLSICSAVGCWYKYGEYGKDWCILWALYKICTFPLLLTKYIVQTSGQIAEETKKVEVKPPKSLFTAKKKMDPRSIKVEQIGNGCFNGLTNFIDAVEIARQITLLEYTIFTKLTPEELLSIGWMKESKGNKFNSFHTCMQNGLHQMLRNLFPNLIF